MLCATCPKRVSCKEPCIELSKDLNKLTSPEFLRLKSPSQIERIEESQAEQNFYKNGQSELANFSSPQPPIPLDVGRLIRALNFITYRQRECIRMAYWEDLSHEEIGERLEISRQAVSKCLDLARTRLKEEYLTDLVKTSCPITQERVRGLDLQSA